MQILIKNDETIAKAHKEYEHFTNDQKLRDLYESRLKWKLDYNSDMESARQDGIEKGKKEGRDEGREEGRDEGKQYVLIRLLSKKFGLLKHKEGFIQSIYDDERLDKAIDSILFATTKDEILAFLK